MTECSSAQHKARRCLLLFCLGLWLAGGNATAAAGVSSVPAVVPPRQVEQQSTLPSWKKEWDTARRLARDGDYQGAALLYERLLASRHTLEEARWELGKIYLRLRQWQKAGVLLEAMVDAAPDRLDYLKALGSAMLAQSHWGRAMELFAKVREREPGDPTAIKGTIRALLALGRAEEALPFLEAAHRQEPNNDKLRRDLAELAYRLNQFEVARPHLVALAAADNAGPELLLMAARLHDRLGLENPATEYWQRLVKLNPDHTEARQRLALFFEKGGRFGEALPHLLALKRQNPNDSALLLRIGKGLVAASRAKEALPYLEQYVQARPGDAKVLEMLVNIYGTSGTKAEALASLERFFAVESRPDAGKLLQAARLYDAAGRHADAVGGYRRYLAAVGVNAEAEAAMAADLRTLGVLGQFAALEKFAGQGVPVAGMDTDRYRLTLAAAFAAGGLYQRALDECGAVLTAGKGGGQALPALWATAELYREMDLFFEAEQALRQALVLGDDAGGATLLRLFELALAADDLPAAEVWLRRLAAAAGQAVPAWQLQLAEARLLAARGEYRAALKYGRRLLAELSSPGPGGARKEAAGARVEVGLAVARFAMAAGAHGAALQQLVAMGADEGATDQEYLVLLQRAYVLSGETDKAAEVFSRALAEANREVEGLLRLAELYRREGMAAAMGKVASLAHRQLPASPRGALLVAEAMAMASAVDEAASVLRKLAPAYPGESRAPVLMVRLMFDAGRFEEALALAQSLPVVAGERADLLLLKARCLWALQRWPEAVGTYQAFLTPGVAQLLDNEIRAAGLSSPPLTANPTFWQIVSLRGETPGGFLQTLMAADEIALPGQDEGRRRLDAIAAAHYGRYRWQGRFAVELAARRAVQAKEYLYAVRQYQAVLHTDPEEPSLLFDLAGVYSRLGWLGEEAALYERLAASRSDFPGLGEAWERNRLKRRPRTAVVYGFRQDEGWNGYQAMEKEWQEAQLWLSPQSRHEVELSASSRRYRATDSDRHLRATRARVSHVAGLSSWLTARVGGGFEQPDNEQISATGLLLGELTAKLGDKASVHLAYDRDVVADTYASLARNVVRQTVTGGGSAALLPRLMAGGDYTVVNFSDGNATRGYDFWGAYILFTEPHYLQFRYQYDFKDSKEGALPGPPTPDGFAANDHPYWAPQNYWVNRFSLFFKHRLSEETLDRGRPTYYTAEYSVDYDARGYQIQSLDGHLFMEWTPNFLVEATAGLTTSQSYRRQQVSLSLVYRW